MIFNLPKKIAIKKLKLEKNQTNENLNTDYCGNVTDFLFGIAAFTLSTI